MVFKILKTIFISLIFVLVFGSTNNVNAANNYKLEVINEYKNIEKLLPEGSEVIYMDPDSKNPFILKKDFYNNKNEIIFAAYTNKNIDNVIFLAALKKFDGKLAVFTTVKAEGYAVDVVDFTDFDGDGREDIILGLKIGGAYGKAYAFNVLEDRLDKIFSATYSKLEIIPQNKYGNKSKRAALAFWLKDTGEAFKINVVRWSGKEFIEAKDLYKAYFKKVVQFYEEKVKEMPGAAFYWYYLADAQNKAGLKKEALKSIAKGVSLDSEYPSKQDFEDLKSNIR